jgi:hypothetical protein
MTEHDQQFDDPQRQVSDRLRADLRALFEPPGAVPPEVDKAILQQARRRLARPRRRIIRLRWAAGIAAAAAVLVIGVVLYNAGGPAAYQPIERQVAQRIASERNPLAPAEARADIDDNGRVDILDAFRLARHIEAGDRTEQNWDLNGDGRVDRADVDAVAFAAVRLREGA